MTLRTIPRDRKIRGVVYGSHWQPNRPPRRPQAALRGLPASTTAEVGAALDRYRDRRLAAAWSPEMRALLTALPDAVRERVERHAVVCAALTDAGYAERLIAVEDDRGQVCIVCRLSHPPATVTTQVDRTERRISWRSSSTDDASTTST